MSIDMEWRIAARSGSGLAIQSKKRTQAYGMEAISQVGRPSRLAPRYRTATDDVTSLRQTAARPLHVSFTGGATALLAEAPAGRSNGPVSFHAVSQIIRRAAGSLPQCADTLSNNYFEIVSKPCVTS